MMFPMRSCMRRRGALLCCVALLTLAACAVPTPPFQSATSTATFEPTVAPTPAPTSIPTETPTPTVVPSPTPIPPLELAILWPEKVSALNPVPVEIDLVVPRDVGATIRARAVVFAPGLAHYERFELLPLGGGRFASATPLQLPLDPGDGDWRLMVAVVRHPELGLVGDRSVTFRPDSLKFHDLSGMLPAGVTLLVPQDFIQGESRGDVWAGGREWQHDESAVSLWWAPGPTEPLLYNNALVMLEATYLTDTPTFSPEVAEVEWRGHTAFLFREEWPGAEGGPGEAMVVQGPDFLLYVLRIRSLAGRDVAPIFHQVWETFTLPE